MGERRRGAAVCALERGEVAEVIIGESGEAAVCVRSEEW